MNQLFVLFAADIPDDAVWNEAGDLIIPPGRQLAEHLVASLERRDVRCSEVCQRSFYGWEFEVDIDQLSALAVLQQSTNWLLVLSATRSLTAWMLGKHIGPDELSVIAEAVQKALS